MTSIIFIPLTHKFGHIILQIVLLTIYGIRYLAALMLMIFQNGSMLIPGLATFFVGFGIGGIGNLIPSMTGTCFGRFGFIQANRLVAPINTAVRSTALIIIGAIGVTRLNVAYWVFFFFSILAIIMICFIKPDEKKIIFK